MILTFGKMCIFWYWGSFSGLKLSWSQPPLELVLTQDRLNALYCTKVALTTTKILMDRQHESSAPSVTLCKLDLCQKGK